MGSPTGIELLRHVLLPDGRVELVLKIPNADPALLAGVGGQVIDMPDGVTVTWRWAPSMVPLDPVAACTAAVARPLLAWASAELGEPIDLTA